MTREEREARIDMRVDDAMRLGAALGSWFKSGDRVLVNAGKDAMDAARAVFVREIMHAADSQPEPIDANK